MVAIIWVPFFFAVLRMALAGASRLCGCILVSGSSIRSSLGLSASIAIVVRAAVLAPSPMSSILTEVSRSWSIRTLSRLLGHRLGLRRPARILL